MAEKKEKITIKEAVFVDGVLATKGSEQTVPISDARMLIGMGKAVPGGKQTKAKE